MRYELVLIGVALIQVILLLIVVARLQSTQAPPAGAEADALRVAAAARVQASLERIALTAPQPKTRERAKAYLEAHRARREARANR